MLRTNSDDCPPPLVCQVGTTQIQLSAFGRPVVLTQSRFRLSNGTSPGVVLDVREAMAVPAMRGVNLGGWLVAEEWMAPPLFADVAQDLDGTARTFQSLATGLWITAPQGGMQQVGPWEGGKWSHV